MTKQETKPKPAFTIGKTRGNRVSYQAYAIAHSLLERDVLKHAKENGFVAASNKKHKWLEYKG